MNNTNAGSELWVTDGTVKGTTCVTEQINPGGGNGWYDRSCGFAACRGRLFFCGQWLRTGSKGYELFAWDPGATAMPVGTGNGAATRFHATDPVLGGVTTWSITGAPANTAGLVLLGVPTLSPLLFAGSGLYLDPARVHGALPVTITGGSGSLPLALANDPAYLGAQLAIQGFVGPTATPPFGLDLLRGMWLTFGR